jgi:hypothetical protein
MARTRAAHARRIGSVPFSTSLPTPCNSWDKVPCYLVIRGGAHIWEEQKKRNFVSRRMFWMHGASQVSLLICSLRRTAKKSASVTYVLHAWISSSKLII